MLVEPKIFVFVVIFDVAAKMGDVVGGTPNCGTVIVDVLNCGAMVVVDAPNVRTALFFIPSKLFILLAVVTGRTAAVGVAFEALAVPKTNIGLLVDEVDVEEAVDVLSENAGALDNVDVDVANGVVFANELLAAVVPKILDAKLKGLVVTCGKDVIWLLEGFPKAFTFDCTLLSDWPNTKLVDFGTCEMVPLLPKVNESGAADVVAARLFDALLAVLLKPAALMIDAEVVLTGSIIIPVDGDDKLDVGV